MKNFQVKEVTGNVNPFKRVKSTKKLAVYESQEPCILFIFESGSTGYFHVIIDEPGPSARHWFLEPFEIFDTFGITL